MSPVTGWLGRPRKLRELLGGFARDSGLPQDDESQPIELRAKAVFRIVRGLTHRFELTHRVIREVECAASQRHGTALEEREILTTSCRAIS
jgi:hypothetical protein